MLYYPPLWWGVVKNKIITDIYVTILFRRGDDCEHGQNGPGSQNGTGAYYA